MRKKFSERYGFANVRDSFQIESMDEGLKNRLWNKIRIIFIDTLIGYKFDGKYTGYVESEYGKLRVKEHKDFILKIYDQFFKDDVEPLLYSKDQIKNYIKIRYSDLLWYEVYDFIEYISEIYYIEEVSNNFRKEINQILEEEMSGYRFVDNYIAPIIDNIEIKEIEEALDCKYIPVKQHLSNALELLSDRENPDYQNSIKESITAVESVAKIITGKETDLANCLKVMDIDLNKQFKTAMTNLYGWTCKEDGIRHGHTGEELKTSFEEAKYMLVSCSAFVNYLISKNS